MKSLLFTLLTLFSVLLTSQTHTFHYNVDTREHIVDLDYKCGDTIIVINDLDYTSFRSQINGLNHDFVTCNMGDTAFLYSVCVSDTTELRISIESSAYSSTYLLMDINVDTNDTNDNDTNEDDTDVDDTDEDDTDVDDTDEDDTNEDDTDVDNTNEDDTDVDNTNEDDTDVDDTNEDDVDTNTSNQDTLSTETNDSLTTYVNHSEFENYNIFPNPFIDIINITNVKNKNVIIFDNSGKIIKNEIVNGDKSFDMSNLSNGIYFIRIDNKVNKIIKN
jgi:hypothetical protein